MNKTPPRCKDHPDTFPDECCGLKKLSLQEEKKTNICIECGASDSCKAVSFKEYKVIKEKFNLVGYNPSKSSLQEEFEEFTDTTHIGFTNCGGEKEKGEILSFIEEKIEEAKKIPMGVSNWREYGKKNGYDTYFIEQAKQEGRAEADWHGEKLLEAIESGKKQEREKIMEVIEKEIDTIKCGACDLEKKGHTTLSHTFSCTLGKRIKHKIDTN